MPTDRLLNKLSADARPVPKFYAFRRLSLGTGLGAAASAVLMLIWLGIRPDIASAAATAPFWVKFAYTVSGAGAALWLVERLGRPGARTGTQAVTAAIPLVLIIALGAAQWLAAAPAERLHLTLGASYYICPWRILALSAPVHAGAFWALRGLAPTRPGFAGAVAGVCAGGGGAFIYAFHCDENAMPFVAIWYTIGIALSGVVGALLGRRLLRW